VIKEILSSISRASLASSKLVKDITLSYSGMEWDLPKIVVGVSLKLLFIGVLSILCLYKFVK
jgi:hypothetical protein